MKQDKRPKIKLRRHKLTSIVFPAVGGAIVVGGAAAGIAVGMINFPPFAADQPEIVLDPHNPVTKVTFNVKDKIDGDVTLTMGSTQSNDEEATQVIFNNESGQKDIVKPDGGKVVTEVTLSNPPTKTGKYEYSYNITATYSTEGHEVERVISGLKLSLEVVQEFVTIDDSNVEGLEQTVTLDNQIYQRVELKGFRYHGDINKNNFTIDMSNVIYDSDEIESVSPSIEFHENETFDVMFDLYGPSEATITGSIKYNYAGEQVGDVESNINITIHEQNTILRPAIPYAAPTLDAYNNIGFSSDEPNAVATFYDLPYTGFIGKEPSDITVENTFAESLSDEDKSLFKFNAKVTEFNTEDLQNKKLTVAIEIRVANVLAAAKTLNGITGNLTFKCDGLNTITLKDFSISLLESSAIAAPTIPSSFKVLDNTENKLIISGWSYSGLQNVSPLTLKVTSDEVGEGKDFTKFEIANIKPTQQTFDLIIYSTNTKAFVEKQTYNLSNLKFQYKSDSTGEFRDVYCSADHISFMIAHADHISYDNAQYDSTVKMDERGMVTVHFSNLSYTGFESAALKAGLQVIPEFIDSTSENIPCEATNIKFDDGGQGLLSFDILFSGTAIKTYTFASAQSTITFKSNISDPAMKDIVYHPANGLTIQEANSITDPAMSETFSVQMDYTTDVKININGFHYSGLEALTPETLNKLSVDISALIGTSELPEGTVAAVSKVDKTNKMFDVTITVPLSDATRYNHLSASGVIKFRYTNGTETFEHTTKTANVECTTAPRINTSKVVCPESKQMVDGKASIKLTGFATQGVFAQPLVEPKGSPALTYTCEVSNWVLKDGKATFDVDVTISSPTKLRENKQEVLGFTFKDSKGAGIRLDNEAITWTVNVLAEDGIKDITTKTASAQFDYTSKKASVTYKGFEVIGMKKDTGKHWSDYIVASSSFIYEGLTFNYLITDDSTAATKFDLQITITASTQDATLIPWSFKNKEVYFNYKDKPAENIETLSGFEMSIGAANYVYDVTDGMKTKTGKIDVTSKTAKIYLGYFDYSGFATKAEQDKLTVTTASTDVTMSREFKTDTHCINVWAEFKKPGTYNNFKFSFNYNSTTTIKASENWNITVYDKEGVSNAPDAQYTQSIELNEGQKTATVEIAGFTYTGFDTQEEKNKLSLTTTTLTNAKISSYEIEWYKETEETKVINKFKVKLYLTDLAIGKNVGGTLALSWGSTPAETFTTKSLNMSVVSAPVETVISDENVKKEQTGYFNQNLQCVIRYSGFKYKGDKITKADDIDVITTLPTATGVTISNPVIELNTQNKTFDVVVTFKANTTDITYKCTNAILLFSSTKLDGTEYQFFSTGYGADIDNPISIDDSTAQRSVTGLITPEQGAQRLVAVSGFKFDYPKSFTTLVGYINVLITDVEWSGTGPEGSIEFDADDIKITLASNNISIKFLNKSLLTEGQTRILKFSIIFNLTPDGGKTNYQIGDKRENFQITLTATN